MEPITTLTAIAVLVAFPFVLYGLVRLLAPTGAAFSSLFAPIASPDWPPGVQEDEPVRWRVELYRSSERQATGGPRRQASARAPEPVTHARSVTCVTPSPTT